MKSELLLEILEILVVFINCTLLLHLLYLLFFLFFRFLQFLNSDPLKIPKIDDNQWVFQTFNFNLPCSMQMYWICLEGFISGGRGHRGGLLEGG